MLMAWAGGIAVSPLTGPMQGLLIQDVVKHPKGKSLPFEHGLYWVCRLGRNRGAGPNGPSA